MHPIIAPAVKRRPSAAVATGLVAAQKLGEQTAYIGVLSDDNGGKFLKEDFVESVDFDKLILENALL